MQRHYWYINLQVHGTVQQAEAGACTDLCPRRSAQSSCLQISSLTELHGSALQTLAQDRKQVDQCKTLPSTSTQKHSKVLPHRTVPMLFSAILCNTDLHVSAYLWKHAVLTVWLCTALYFFRILQIPISPTLGTNNTSTVQ